MGGSASDAVLVSRSTTKNDQRSLAHQRLFRERRGLFCIALSDSHNLATDAPFFDFPEKNWETSGAYSENEQLSSAAFSITGVRCVRSCQRPTAIQQYLANPRWLTWNLFKSRNITIPFTR